MRYRLWMRLAICLLAVLLLAGCNNNPEPETTAPVETTVETLPPPTTPEDGNPDDVTCKGTYTVRESVLAKNAPTVVARVGDEKLTVKQLQVYYWLAVDEFRQSGAAGPDFSQDLDTQLCDLDDTAVTWQQYFLQKALDTWHTHQALVLMGETVGIPTEEAYKPIAERHEEYMVGQPATKFLYGYNSTPFVPNTMHQEWLDAIPELLQTLAEEKGFADAEALAKAFAGVDANSLERYVELANRSYMYFTERHYEIKPTAEEVEAWYTEHEAEYAAAGVTKTGEKTVNVRHVLLVPTEEPKPAWMGGGEVEVAEVAEDGKVTCSEELWETGRLAAEKMLNTWAKDRESSEYTFAALAAKNSVDMGSKYNGGMYSDVHKGQLAPVLDEWCFNEARQAGDTAILRSEWGWHLMYFSGANEAWYKTAEADYIAAQDAKLIAESKELNEMKVNYGTICLGAAEETAELTMAKDLLYPDVAHERFPEVPLYLQQDYPGTMYGYYSIVTHGCGITTLAMLASYMSDEIYTPPVLCEEYADYCYVNGTDGSLFVEAPPEMNFYLIKQSFNCNEVLEYLKEGHLVVVVQTKGYWTSGGHYLVLEKALENGMIQVRDSNVFNYGKLKHHLEDAHPWNSITPAGMSFWIYEYKQTTVPACHRCGDGTGAGIPDGLLLAEYTCEKCHKATTRRDNFLALSAQQ